MEEGFTAKDAKDRKGTQQENAVSKAIVDAAFRVHSALGPGLLESAYEAFAVILSGGADAAA